MKTKKILVRDDNDILSSTKQHYIAERGKLISTMVDMIDYRAGDISKLDMINLISRLVEVEEGLNIIEKYFEENK